MTILKFYQHKKTSIIFMSANYYTVLSKPIFLLLFALNENLKKALK